MYRSGHVDRVEGKGASPRKRGDAPDLDRFISASRHRYLATVWTVKAPTPWHHRGQRATPRSRSAGFPSVEDNGREATSASQAVPF